MFLQKEAIHQTGLFFDVCAKSLDFLHIFKYLLHLQII